MSLRKKIVDSETFNTLLTSVFETYLRFAYRTSRWERTGFEDMDAAVQGGDPVIVAIWHQRLMMAPYIFDTSKGKICSLTSSGRAGVLAGRLQQRFGFGTISMSSHKRHVALSREVLGRIRSGYSIGIAVDGPRGPARQASTVPLVWARVTGKRVFVVSYSSRRAIEFPTWDKMMMPVPFTRGVLTCREWDETVPRKASDADIETLRVNLQTALDAVTDASDLATGRARNK